MAQDKKTARRLARENGFALLYESEFHADASPEAIFDLAVADRDINGDDEYLRKIFFGTMTHMEELDALIGRHAKGWKTNRLSRVSRAILRLATYEMMYVEDVPPAVAINEAVELTKQFDDPKARAFINGVLNAVKNELAAPAPAAEAGATKEVAADADATPSDHA